MHDAVADITATDRGWALTAGAQAPSACPWPAGVALSEIGWSGTSGFAAVPLLATMKVLALLPQCADPVAVVYTLQ